MGQVVSSECIWQLQQKNEDPMRIKLYGQEPRGGRQSECTLFPSGMVQGGGPLGEWEVKESLKKPQKHITRKGSIGALQRALIARLNQPQSVKPHCPFKTLSSYLPQHWRSQKLQSKWGRKWSQESERTDQVTFLHWRSVGSLVKLHWRLKAEREALN